jgi:hypothetical protein
MYAFGPRMCPLLVRNVLSNKAITDRLTRSLVLLGDAAGMMYNALWYFPMLMVFAGCAGMSGTPRLCLPVG